MALLNLVVLALAAVAWGEDTACDKDSEGSCAPSMLEIKQASVNKQENLYGTDDAGEKSGADLATSIANWRAKYSYSTHYCYEFAQYDCWVKKPTTAEECTPFSGNTTCKCAGDSCYVDFTPGKVTGRCVDTLVYVAGSRTESHGSGIGVSATSKELFCTRMVANDKWGQGGLLPTTPEKKDKEQQWWGGYICPSGYTQSHWSLIPDGKCHRKRRYLGETCWQAWGETGSCVTGSGEYKTACYEDTCVPYAAILDRHPCECSWVGVNFFVVCSAKKNKCNGHACVWNTGDGNHYCDYGTSQDWQTLISR